MSIVSRLNAIGDAMRAKLGTKDLIPLSDMPSKVTDVYNAGMLYFYNFFGNTYLHGTYFSYTFAGTHWTDSIFAPNKDLKPVYILHIFTTSAIVDIVGCLQRAGRVFDSSKAYYINYIAKDNQYSKNMPFIDTSSCGNLKCFFYNCNKLEIMEGIKFKNDGSQLFDQNYSFGKLPELRDIKRIEGVIGQDGVDFSGSPKLSKDTYYRIFNVLSSSSQGKIITFSEAGVDETFRGYGNVNGPGSTIIKYTDDCKGSWSQEWLNLIKNHPNWSVALK